MDKDNEVQKVEVRRVRRKRVFDPDPAGMFEGCDDVKISGTDMTVGQWMEQLVTAVNIAKSKVRLQNGQTRKPVGGN
jgi:hypothetical protein